MRWSAWDEGSANRPAPPPASPPSAKSTPPHAQREPCLVPDDPRDRRKTPSSGSPVVARTPTNDQLAAEVKRLTALLQRPDLEKRVERVEQTANRDLLPFIRETGARYTEVASGLASLAAEISGMSRAMTQFRSDVGKRLDGHDDRIFAVEDRSARHEVRLDVLDELPSKVAALQQHAASTNTELALTRKQKTGVAALGSLSGALAWLLAKLFGG